MTGRLTRLPESRVGVQVQLMSVYFIFSLGVFFFFGFWGYGAARQGRISYYFLDVSNQRGPLGFPRNTSRVDYSTTVLTADSFTDQTVNKLPPG